MAFYFRDYWAQPLVGELDIFDFGKGADGKAYSWITWNSGDNRHFYQEDYHDNKWTSTWCLDYFHWQGVLETADVYPKYAYQFWTSYRTTTFVTGKEIAWGGLQNVGDEFTVDVQIDPIRSTKVTIGTPGKQRVKFCNQYSLFKTADGKKNYNDVIEIEYDQSFGAGKSAGWRAWHARGIGITQIVWRYDGKDIGDPQVANISTVKGYIKDKYPVLT